MRIRPSLPLGLSCCRQATLAIFAAGLVVIGWASRDAAAQAESTNAPVSTAESQANGHQTAEPSLQRWIKELDANRYEIREMAQRQLSQLGMKALDAVTFAAQEGSLESSTRALNILLTWSDSAEAQLRITALERIAALSNRPKEAGIAAGLITEAREQAALRGIAQLGGSYRKDRQIHGIDNLQITISKKWKGGIKGLEHLAQIPRATTISFHSVELDDSALESLRGLGHVERMEFYGTAFSEEAIKKLDDELPPSVKVVPRGGALLGIQGNVIKVEPRTAAFRAGIRPGDRITQIEGEDVADFDALTERIGKHKPGDTVELTVLRKNGLSKVQVTFGQWGDQTLDEQHINQQVKSNTGNLKPGNNKPVLNPRKISIERR